MLERLRLFVHYGKAAGALPHPTPQSASGGPFTVAQPCAAPAELATATATPTFAGTRLAADSAHEVGRETMAQDAAARRRARYTREAEKIVAHERADAEQQRMPEFRGLPERYELICQLGHGTFSQVMRARDKATGDDVALKIVSKAGIDHQADRLDANFRHKAQTDERATVLKEVQMLRRASHPSIVRLIDFSESSEYYFLVLELLDGGELFEQIVRLTYFSEPLARHVVLQVAHAIRHLHEECGIVHRDIKPENLLFQKIDVIPNEHAVRRPYDEDKEDEGIFREGIGGGGIGVVKLGDFGLSKVVGERGTKTPCGTVGYTAPEIVNDEYYSKSVDMWALGCVLYTILCGFPPFFDESITKLTQKVSRGEYAFLSPWWDDISDAAKDLVARLLCVDPKERYTVDQFLQHEWCTGPAVALPAPRSAVPDVPLLDEQPERIGAKDTERLREAFDVTYAVHRLAEEERMRRSANPAAREPREPSFFSLHMDNSSLLARRRAARA